MSPPTPEEIRTSRRAQRLTQLRAAELVHVTARTWSMWENGSHPMPLTAWELFTIKAKAGATA